MCAEHTEINLPHLMPLWKGTPMLWISAQPHLPWVHWKQLDGSLLWWHEKLSLAEAAMFSMALHGAAAVAPLFPGFPRLLCVSAAWLNGLSDVLRKKTVRNSFLPALLVINRMFQICLFFAHGKLYGHLADVETHWFYIQQLGKTMDVILCLTKYMLGRVHLLC